MGGQKGVPDRWLDYSPIGKKIPGTVIICFKVPLKEEISRNVPESDRFTPSMLIHKVPNLAGVIDVTNTTRYYSKQVFVDKGILHEKILCPGHVVPPARVVQSYLIECCGFHPDDAIRLFAEGRGHSIERDNYLSDLRRLQPSPPPPSRHHAPVLPSAKERGAWAAGGKQRSREARSGRDDASRRRLAGAYGPPPPRHLHTWTRGEMRGGGNAWQPPHHGEPERWWSGERGGGGWRGGQQYCWREGGGSTWGGERDWEERARWNPYHHH
ncbi:RNA/RNP complex-1-interacting phosphatase isoform X2 [Ischnura elegans]|uniref:RNA/RNP complex-1-interacting phosphatase isoform X2 n=1 Tax=Ischnura elegans TaxID=197161 RepID=UPI001ED87B3B|nr:RNA/RNP complex-1-interacting phosphatase isoform X2 [Ischnura elegans]